MIAAILIASILLSLERIFYVWAWRNPTGIHRMHRWSAFRHLKAPTDVVRTCFFVFKLIQFSVFAGWWHYFQNVVPAEPTGPALLAGGILIVIGQVLNFSVFARLGSNGVFYGSKLGYPVPWQTGFPFNWVNHPQYVGTVMSIWGLFLVIRYPAPDWWILPVIETVYYTLGARYER